VYHTYVVSESFVYMATIWKGEVPHGVTQTYSQAQNDTDKADFEDHYKAGANGDPFPRTSDGKRITLTSLFPGGVYYYLTGQGDTTTTRGDGEAFEVSVSGTSASDPTPSDFDFLDWVYVAGGSVRWKNAVLGDYVSMELVIPATPAPTSTPGTGNCNIVNTVVLVPAAGNGSHTVDLTTAIPVPAADEVLGTSTGYWDWSEPDTGKGTITASATPGAAKWHLMTVAPSVVRFINRLRILGDGTEDVSPDIKPKKILPHWLFRIAVHSAGRPSGNLDVTWSIKTGRVKTA
jgi:hypothetical protein